MGDMLRSTVDFRHLYNYIDSMPFYLLHINAPTDTGMDIAACATYTKASV